MVLGRLMDRAPARASELHRRASTFLAKSGQPLDALEHAQLSGDENFLADQLDLLSEDLVYTGYLYRIDELAADLPRSEEHTSELQSLMRISYAVFCLKKKKNDSLNTNNRH